MRRRVLHVRPLVEQIESRELPSAILVANIAAAMRRAHQAPSATLGVPPFNSTPQQFGDHFENLLVSPDPNAVPTAREQRRESFRARFTDGSYGIGPGRFSNEASHTYLRAIGMSNQMLNSNMQFAFVQSKDLTKPPAGEMSIFDKNISTGNQLGFFAIAEPGAVDRKGRPTRFLIYQKDVNQAASFYDQGTGVGTIDVHYYPQKTSRQGKFESGRFNLVVRAQVYNLGTTAILTNAYSNP
ncbi:hypothetical protein SAMN05444166_3732 [Singulisphaera sp. GP187]|uniref:hypothetical protein n=1 Tax=Singulisphaera sp. GP187 TaxID=1882752 RepID=UPI000927B212|nr:hypothetical protein [Singulisphaera sp. GP187]SIO31643.1 hypothetical protein SAMN05444166_3732 [Singulisphaera sp. GP187]